MDSILVILFTFCLFGQCIGHGKFPLQVCLRLGEGVNPRGGVESRSDLPDLKSSKVDFNVGFLTKVEEKSGTRL